MTLDPDPSVIGGVDRPPFARMPAPEALFTRRAARFAHLAQDSQLRPYLEFLAGLCRIQAEMAATLPPPDPVPAARIALLREARMPPLDRQAMTQSAAMGTALDRLLEAAADLPMPEAARAALEAVRIAGAEDRDWLLENVLSDAIPPEAAAPHLLVAAAVQLVMAQAAAALDAERLVAIDTGICPACGGRPCTSLVVETPGAEGVRYATCATCATAWNEVRIKCLCCGSTKGIGYRALEEAAVVKAEICDECGSWVKILYQNLNPSLEAVADDVASLGLDARMRDTAWRRRGVNPFLTGY